MKIVDSVFEIANEFMNNPRYVQLNPTGIKEVSQRIQEDLVDKPDKQPTLIYSNNEFDVYKEILMQLAGGAINYCYWYGNSNVRPLGCSSVKMFEIMKANEDWIFHDKEGIAYQAAFFKEVKKDFATERFPLHEERVKHLDEIAQHANEFVVMIMNKCIRKQEATMFDLFKTLLWFFPGYASDIFLKRASLFFLMLYRNFGWFEEEIRSLPVPADYQVPKMLEFFECLDYSEELVETISNNILIPKGSEMECELRAATIVACDEICGLTGLNISDVDFWFWAQRKECKNPFHLTITTDY